MKKINNLDEFYAEKNRLELEVIEAEIVLKEDLKWIKEELKPENIASTVLKGFFKKGAGGLVDQGIGSVIGSIIKNVFLFRSGWITRLIVPFIAKNVSSGYLADNKAEIFGILRNLVEKVRKFTQHKKSRFDKSTVDEADF